MDRWSRDMQFMCCSTVTDVKLPHTPPILWSVLCCLSCLVNDSYFCARPSGDEKQRWWLVYSTGSARVSDILWDPLMCVAPTPGFLLSGNCILSVSTADKWSRKGAAHCHRPVLYNTMACIMLAVCGFIWCCWPVNVHMHSMHTPFLTTKYFRQHFFFNIFTKIDD